MKQIFLLIIFVIIDLLSTVSCSELPQNPSEGKGLYIYSGKKFSRFFRDAGYQEFWKKRTVISRNSDGTALRFVNSEQKGLVLTCKGTLQELEVPGFPVWFNDDHQVIAWFDRNKKMVYYKYGPSEKMIAGTFGFHEGPDPSGTYFFKHPHLVSSLPLREYCTSEIYAVEQPYQPLMTVPVCSGGRIFLKDGYVYLFGIDYEDEVMREEDFKADVTTAHIFQVTGERFTEIKTVKIRRPKPPSPAAFGVIDVSPWSDEALFMDTYDPPGLPIWYIYNFQTHDMKKIGKLPSPDSEAFFLQCNILEEVLNNLKNKE